MIANKTYVCADERGILRVGGTRVSLDSVVYAFLQGHAPETIQDQYPILGLEEVYGAVAFYLSNRLEVDDYLKQRQQLWDEARQQAEQKPSNVVQRLRALKRAAGRQDS